MRQPEAALLWLGLAIGGLLIASASAGAEPYAVGSAVEPFEIADQHGEVHRVDESVRAILFSRDMDGGDLIEAVLEDGGRELMQASGSVYVADIHRMPGLITRLFALPSLRRRDYPILLDREGELTERFPDAEGEATLIELDALRVTRVRHFDEAAPLREALGELRGPPSEASGS